ncbi:MAG TPA: DUF1549 domain-containing protein, partial [Pirellulales bacterium]|nr:DUF1549 domain-containing protein [Pirellulales bacterium]
MWKICACAGLMVALADGVSVPAQVPPSDDLSSEIDALVDSACGAAGTTPAATCDDATFLRRAWLDLAGRVPPLLAARDFLKDEAADKRARLVDELLGSEEFADHWGRVFAEFLTDRRAVAQPPYNGRVLHDYLRKALAADTSYRQIARDLIAGSGPNDASGPANFLLCYQVDPAQLTGAVAKKFLGVSLECAQCHHHPFDRWTRDDFWGIAACFARTRQMNSNDGQLFAVVDARAGELEIDAPPAAVGDDASATASSGEAPAEAPPQKQRVGPRLLDGTTLAADSPRRAELAAWITGGGNVDFARQATNVVWRTLFSQRLAAAHGDDSPFAKFEAELLDRLATAFAAGDFRVKRLLRAILLSRAYARESAVSWHSRPRLC